MQGLLSELIEIDVKFASEPDASLPSTFVVKFSPPAVKTMITINLGKAGQTEFFIYKKLAPYFPCRVPRLWAADMNFTSGKQCMVMDKIDGEFIAITEFNKITIKHVEKVLDVLAQIHATFWGDKSRKPGLAWLLNPNHASIEPAWKIANKYIKKSWDMWIDRVADPGFPVGDGTGFAKMEVPQEVVDLKDYLYIANPDKLEVYLQAFNGPHSEWLTFCHGDARLDNFFFDEETWASEDGMPGVIDLQLCQCANCALDVVYCLSIMSTYYRWPEEVDRLMRRYFDKLQAAGGAPGKELAEFEEQMAHAAWLRMMAAVLGTGGVDVENALNPQQVLEVTHLLNTGALLSSKYHGAVDAVRATADGASDRVANVLSQVSTFEMESKTRAS
jgi:aminoglycoside phosphotransferase (APT) family kinase protein